MEKRKKFYKKYKISNINKNTTAILCKNIGKNMLICWKNQYIIEFKK